MRIKILLAMFAMFPTVAMADGGMQQDGSAGANWRVDLGLGDVLAPAFPGAKTYRNNPLPSVSVDYKDRVFFSLQQGLRVNAFDQDGWTAGPLLSFDFGRRTSADRKALSGLTDVPFSVAGGAFINYDFGDYASARVQVTQAFGGSKGLDARAGILGKAPPLLDDRLFLSGGPTVDFYNSNYSKAYFGVSNTDALHSIYRAFEPKSGEEIGVSADAEYLITDRVSLNIFGAFGKYTGDIAKSPILRGPYGSSTQLILVTALTYRFTY
jgi:outer membrane scaffolding protein for murein synthesis (MipA/OmpV family)